MTSIYLIHVHQLYRLWLVFNIRTGPAQIFHAAVAEGDPEKPTAQGRRVCLS